MSNVKVKVGQVWKLPAGFTVTVDTVCDAIVTCGNAIYNIDRFNNLLTFIPQNDLEFWAVEIDVWPDDSWKSLWFRRDERGAITHEAQIIRTEWQNMRYELGVDVEKAMRKLTQKEVDDAPDWASHYFIDSFGGSVCYEDEGHFQYAGKNKVKSRGMCDNAEPIPRKEFDLHEAFEALDCHENWSPYLDVGDPDEVTIDGVVMRGHAIALAKHFKLTAEDLK